jgi:hypothetical protein
MTRHTQAANSKNCVQVCLASIFDGAVGRPPHVFANEKPHEGWTNRRWKKLSRWCETQGHTAYALNADAVQDQERIYTLEYSGTHYIGIFKVSGRYDAHAVVMWMGEIAHDPAGNSGIVGRPLSYIGFEKRTSWAWLWWFMAAVALLALFGHRSSEIQNRRSPDPPAHHKSTRPAHRQKGTRSVER